MSNTRKTRKNGKVSKVLERLPKSNNGHRRKSVACGAFLTQKDEIRKRAHAAGKTVSRYVHELLWGDWL